MKKNIIKDILTFLPVVILLSSYFIKDNYHLIIFVIIAGLIINIAIPLVELMDKKENFFLRILSFIFNIISISSILLYIFFLRSHTYIAISIISIISIIIISFFTEKDTYKFNFVVLIAMIFYLMSVVK